MCKERYFTNRFDMYERSCVCLLITEARKSSRRQYYTHGFMIECKPKIQIANTSLRFVVPTHFYDCSIRPRIAEERIDIGYYEGASKINSYRILRVDAFFQTRGYVIETEMRSEYFSF